MAYIRGNSSPEANLGVLDKLIFARHELAQVIYFYLQNLLIVYDNNQFDS